MHSKGGESMEQNQDNLSENTIKVEPIETNHSEVMGKEPLPIDSVDVTAGIHYAGFWMRFWAYLADLIIIGSLTRIFVSSTFKALGGGYVDYSFFSPATILEVTFFYLYFVLMTRYFGQTLGKMIFGLRVISLKDDKLTWGTLIFREFIGRFISKFTSIGYILVGILPKKQGLHDIFADTTVVMIRR